MQVDDFDFDLPESLISLRPARPRDTARLLHIPAQGDLGNRIMRDLPDLLRAGDALVVNVTKVIPARLLGVRLFNRLRATRRARVEHDDVSVHTARERIRRVRIRANAFHCQARGSEGGPGGGRSVPWTFQGGGFK